MTKSQIARACDDHLLAALMTMVPERQTLPNQAKVGWTGGIARTPRCHFTSKRRKPCSLQGFRTKRATGVEPATFGLGSQRSTN